MQGSTQEEYQIPSFADRIRPKPSQLGGHPEVAQARKHLVGTEGESTMVTMYARRPGSVTLLYTTADWTSYGKVRTPSPIRRQALMADPNSPTAVEYHPADNPGPVTAITGDAQLRRS
jgi:hypothetical protein